jgi:hypothetical protein
VLLPTLSDLVEEQGILSLAASGTNILERRLPS